MEQVFFRNIQSAIISELQQATQSIQIAVCWFTNKAIFDVLAQKSSEGVAVTLILLDDYANKRKEGLPLNDLIGLGAKIYFSDKTAPIHHKFCIIDKAILLSGSYDWTYFSESKAMENIMIIKENQDLVAAFVSEFEMLTSVLSHIENITPYSMTEGLLRDMFGLKNYLSEDVYLQALKADENGEDLNALNLMHHSALIDEHKAEEQTAFIKEKQAKPESPEAVNVTTQELNNEQENTKEGIEEEETKYVPVYTSRGIGFTPTPPPMEEEVHEENSEAINETSSEITNETTSVVENAAVQETENFATASENVSEISQEQPLNTEEIHTQEDTGNTQYTETPPVEENTSVTGEIPPAPVEFIPNPEAESAIQQGELAYQQGRLEDAAQFFTQAMMMQGNNAKAYLNMAIVKFRMGRFSEQAEFAAQSVQYDPSNAKAFNTLALAQDKLGNFVDAINNYSRALELSPENYSYLWNRAVALKQVGRRQEAVIDFGKVVKLCNQVVMSNPANQNAKMTMEAAMREMGS